jgi:hypothetical protein
MMVAELAVSCNGAGREKRSVRVLWELWGGDLVTPCCRVLPASLETIAAEKDALLRKAISLD